jgi:hypothetical protein
MAIKHFVDEVEYATVVEVLNGLDAANQLGYKNNKYAGTAIYAHMMDKRADFGVGIRVGVNIYYPRENIEVVAKRYINRGSIKESVDALMKFVKSNPETASALLALAKQTNQ